MNTSNIFDAGVLYILRQAAWVRAGLIALSIILYIAWVPNQSALPLLCLFAFERAMFGLMVNWDRARKKMGAAFVLVAISWLMVTPMLEIALSLASLNEALRIIGEQTDALGVSSPLIWLVVPVVLSAWQYGRRGWQTAVTVLFAEHLMLGFVLWSSGLFVPGYFLNSAGRIAMLTILGYVVMLLVEAQKQEHRALEQANRQLAQRAATAEQLAESRERNRMARELHDILAHSLTALSLQLQAVGTLLDHEPAEAKAQLREAQLTTRASANEVRRAIKKLRATPLEELGLAEALRELCRAQAERTNAQFDFSIADPGALDPLTEQAVYRIASEALVNIERHASATQVRVTLEHRADSKLCLTIQDNGVGFDRQTVPADRYGLTGMSERAHEIGGKLLMQSMPHSGTTIQLEIPI